MRRIAIISDVHGNYEALKAVFQDIQTRNVDEIYCLGDIIAKGIHSRECLNLIRKKCSVFLRGNWEDNMSKDLESFDMNPRMKERIRWNQSLLSLEDVNFCSHFPFCHEFYMSGLLIRLFHATPEKIDRPVSPTSSLRQKFNQFLPSKNTVSDQIADIVIFGHIHTQFMEHLYNRTLINVGSVGNPMELIRNDSSEGNFSYITKAQYFILEGEYGSKNPHDPFSFQFIKVSYDCFKELQDSTLNPEKEEYITELMEARYRDQEQLKANFLKQGINMDDF